MVHWGLDNDEADVSMTPMKSQSSDELESSRHFFPSVDRMLPLSFDRFKRDFGSAFATTPLQQVFAETAQFFAR